MMEYSCFDFRPFGVAKSLCTLEDFVHFVDEFDFASFADFMPTCAKDHGRQWRNGRVSGCPVTGGPRTLGAPDKNDHEKFDSTFLGFLEKCFNFGEKYHIFGKCLGVSGKNFSYLGKIGVCPENFFDSQNGTLTEIFLATGGARSPKWSTGGPKVAD
jgi:hypothetical protein